MLLLFKHSLDAYCGFKSDEAEACVGAALGGQAGIRKGTKLTEVGPEFGEAADVRQPSDEKFHR